MPGGALATLLLAAAATAVLVPGGAFGQQQQQHKQVSWWEIEKAEKVGKKTFFLDVCFLVCKLAMLYKSEQRLLKVYTYKHTYTTRHTHMGNVNRAVSSFPIFPGSAAGAAALKYVHCGHQDSKDNSALRFKGCFCYHLKIPLYPCSCTALSPKCSILLAGYWYFISPFHHKKETEICFDLFFRWVLRLFVPLVLLFQFLGFCLWKCQASIFGQVLKLEDFPKSTNWWWVKHTLNIAGNTKPHNWCVPCAFSIHASAKYLHQ